MDSHSPTRTSREQLQHQFEQQRLNHPKLWRKLQVQKSVALGLVIPCANLQLEVRYVDRADQDLGPAFQTSNLNWVECFVTMLPKFELFPATLDGEEVTLPIAKVSRPLFNYYRKTLADIEMPKLNPPPQFSHNLPSPIRTSWKIKHLGLHRHYTLIGRSGKDTHTTATFAWKGSKHILAHLEDYNPSCHGNLKLIAEDGTLLAAWKQQRNTKVLGSIHVFEEARDKVPVEVIVVSCLCIVIVEKTTGVTWLGGM